MTPLRAIALLANPDSPGFSSALTTLTELDVNALSSHEQVSLLAALDAAVQSWLLFASRTAAYVEGM